MGEAVDHPSHYQVDPFWCSEVVDIVEAYKLGFNDGNALKYLLRAGKKNLLDQALGIKHQPERDQDIKKAIWYLERMLGKHKRQPPTDSHQPRGSK